MITKIMVTLMTIASMMGSPSGSYIYKDTDDYYNDAEVKIMKYSPNEYVIHEEISKEDVDEMTIYSTGEFGKIDAYITSDARGALDMVVYNVWGNIM